ncbi:MAG: methyltransferase family protein [Spirochaetia bacterium]
MGDAPRQFSFLAPFIGAAVAGTILWPDFAGYLGKFWGLGIAAGIALGSLGMVFWAAAAVSLLLAYGMDRLARRGAFGLARHPIFSWWIFFVFPAASFILDSWFFLFLSFLTAVIVRPSLKREDAYLAERYGKKYTRYREKVRSLIPLPKLRPFKLKRYFKGLGGLVIIGVIVLVSFYAVIRPVMLTLGVSRREARAEMPGDEYITGVRQGYTQAFLYEADPGRIWPWLIQMGYGRAGWYNVDAVNRLAASDYFYEGTGSAWKIIPELQNIGKGDTISIVPGMGMTVAEFEENELLVLVGNPADPEAELNAVWTYRLSSPRPGTTRMVVRFSSTFPGSVGAAVLNGIINEIGGAILQQPALFHGIERRVER